MPSRAPILKWLQSVRRMIRRLEPLYWLRCHTVDRYHVINISGQDGYEWGWIDRDRAMYLACFKCLVEYVELEKPGEVIDWESDEDHSRAWKEIQDLYHWWKTGRAKEHAEHDALVDAWRKSYPGGDPEFRVKDGRYQDERWVTWLKRSTELEEKDDEMLMRLMKVRRFLWT
jgi:hypothetical protein